MAMYAHAPRDDARRPRLRMPSRLRILLSARGRHGFEIGARGPSLVCARCTEAAAAIINRHAHHF
jgi:hypothetical protein